MSLFSELKQRNVFRVAAAYIFGAWLVIQVVETIFPAFGFGDSAVRFVVIVFAIGLIPVLVFSWLYEITPEGLKREGMVDHSQPIVLATVKRLDRAIIIILTLALGFFAFDKFILDPARDVALEKSTTERVRTEVLVESYGDSSIAVMPFVNMSDDENEYFSDGMAEELLNVLARIPRLRVISQSSSFSLKGKDLTIPEVAERLNVAFVLEGSVRKSGNQVRITAQLIEGRSDTHLWSDTYDRTLDDVFAVQDEISAAIADELRTRLKLDIGAAPKIVATASTEAHDAVLRGRYLLAQRTVETRGAAVAEFEKAVALDPAYALAHAELAIAIGFWADHGLSEDELRARQKHHVERALALDPGLAEAHAASAWLSFGAGDPDVTRAHFLRAIEINPNYAIVYVWLANMGLFPSHQEAFAAREAAVRLDPLSRLANISYINALRLRNRLAEADQQIEKFASIDPRYAIMLRGDSASLGGHYANFILAYLDAAIDGSDDLMFARGLVEEMAWRLAAVGLEGEALQIAGELPRFQSWVGDAEAAIALAKAEFEEYPEDGEVKLNMAHTLAQAGHYADARPWLEQAWKGFRQRTSLDYEWSWSLDHVAQGLVAALREAGEVAAAAQVLAEYRDFLAGYRDAGIVLTQMLTSVDYFEGVAAYLAGEREAGLALMAKATEDGYWVRSPAAFQQAMYQDPGFVPILEKQKQRQAREREQLLAVVCADNPYATVWKPSEAACAQRKSSGAE